MDDELAAGADEPDAGVELDDVLEDVEEESDEPPPEDDVPVEDSVEAGPEVFEPLPLEPDERESVL